MNARYLFIRQLWIASLLVIAILAAYGTRDAVATPETIGPVAHVYRVVEDDSLHAYVFYPPDADRGRPANAILLFHGGGWAAGSAEWTFATAERFAGYGLVAIAIDYRLSGEKITPVDAMDDVCHAFAWARKSAKELGIGGKVAGYGVSAGGHLLALTSTVGCSIDNARPDAMLLWSPALDMANDGWFGKLLQGRKARDFSPVEHVGPSTAPTSIVQGAEDTLTPLTGAQRFCENVTKAGGVCELNVYAGVGHLLTRNLANQEDDYDPDPAKRAEGIEKHRQFLLRLGFISER